MATVRRHQQQHRMGTHLLKKPRGAERNSYSCLARDHRSDAEQAAS